MTVLVESPGAAATPAGDPAPARLLRVQADLLPGEVIAARRLGALKRRLAVVVAGLVAVVALGYGWSWWQTSGAQDDLEAAQHRMTALQGSVSGYRDLQQMQTRTGELTTRLGQVMTGDLQWSTLIATFRSAAGPLSITGITASVTGANADTGSATTGGQTADPLAGPDVTVVGSVTLSGTAPDSKSVGDFVNRLSTTKGLTSPVPTSVSGQRGAYTFTVTVGLTTDALGGRFTPATASTTPSATTPSTTAPSTTTPSTTTPGGK